MLVMTGGNPWPKGWFPPVLCSRKEANMRDYPVQVGLRLTDAEKQKLFALSKKWQQHPSEVFRTLLNLAAEASEAGEKGVTVDATRSDRPKE